MTKIEMIEEMVEMGYHLMGESVEHFAERLPYELVVLIYHAQRKRVGLE